MADKKKGLSFNMNLTQENMKKTESDVDILILQRFKELVQQSNCFDEYISHDKKIFKIMQKNVDFKLEDFETISELGRGASGRVFKVKHKETGKFYAKKVNLIFLKINATKQAQIEQSMNKQKMSD
ncbi:hypothetical protein ABPG72_017597 [Tetrahymena utriculariae]